MASTTRRRLGTAGVPARGWRSAPLQRCDRNTHRRTADAMGPADAIG
jgi:hypothetical protein